MKRRALAHLLVASALGGCMGGSASSSSTAHAQHGPPASCVAAWNGPANAAVRGAATPPRRPYPWFAHAPVRPQGGFRAFVGLLAVIGGPVGRRPAPCAVYFWFRRGYHGRPALLRFSEVDLGDGVYGQPRIEAGRTMTFHPSGPAYAEDAEGRIRPTSTTPSPAPALPARGAVARVARTHRRGGRDLAARQLRGVRRPERGDRRAGTG